MKLGDVFTIENVNVLNPPGSLLRELVFFEDFVRYIGHGCWAEPYGAVQVILESALEPINYARLLRS